MVGVKVASARSGSPEAAKSDVVGAIIASIERRGTKGYHFSEISVDKVMAYASRVNPYNDILLAGLAAAGASTGSAIYADMARKVTYV
jgi:hypothetical protein